jgi:Na+/H+ antiporter NhaD/arsenite permease-like protein
MNFVTGPLVAVLFLLAISAIGRQEVHDGTIGADNISPLDIMAFFITLAYIAISIDASGLIRWLAFKVLQKGGKVGHRLFFYLYAFFFALGSFIGNDPIILSGTAFLAYMTRVSSNIIHPRAWIHTQFAVANIASAILVSSNPTNLVLAGAFNIKFINYTANMIVPVIVTAVVLFPFLLYIVFADEKLIPISIKMHELSEEEKSKKPVNPNIPNARGRLEEQENNVSATDQVNGNLLSLEEIMNPFLDRGGAAFGAMIMAVTLITILVLNAVNQSKGEHPVFWVTLPAAFVMFCWDVGFGWYRRAETREIAQKGRQEIELARAERAIREEEEARQIALEQMTADNFAVTPSLNAQIRGQSGDSSSNSHTNAINEIELDEKPKGSPQALLGLVPEGGLNEKTRTFSPPESRHTTLTSMARDRYRWCQETFPTVTAVVAHLPFALIPFAFTMFILVQALKTKGWVPVFAYGWDHWVNKTGTVGAIGGMGFLSVILCNVSLLPRYGKMQSEFVIVCRHKYWNYHSSLPDNPIMAGHPRQEPYSHHGSHILGNCIQHGPRCQLWSL